MGIVRATLYRLLGRTKYFRFVSRSFIWLYQSGLLRLFPAFDTHYGVRKLIEPGSTVIDIGANMGYFTTIFASLAGIGGRVFSVEPVSPYRDILQENCAKFNNVTILPYALGDEEGIAILGIPGDKAYRHGLTRVLRKSETSEDRESFMAEVKRPEGLFGSIGEIDYIKCDIEGFEDRVIPGFEEIIAKYHPIIQVEISDENREIIDSYLNTFGYHRFYISRGRLAEAVKGEWPGSDSIYAIPGKVEGLII